MFKRHGKVCTALAVLTTMVVPLFVNININAGEKVVDTFYVLDESGNPEIVETTQGDLDRAAQEEEESTYTIVASKGEEQAVIGEYENIEDAQEAYEDTVAYFKSADSYTVNTISEEDDDSETASEENSTDDTNDTEVIIVSEEGEIPTEDCSTIGVVRFLRDDTTFSYTETDTGRTGYLSPYTAGDAAYIRTEADGVVCRISGVTIKVALEDVYRIFDYETLMEMEGKPFNYYYSYNGYFCHKYSYYSGESLKTGVTRVGYTPAALDASKVYYSYDGHYFYEDFEMMINDYRAGNFDNAANKDQPYYNYYQYLSFHTTACFTGEEYDTYVQSKYSSDKSVMTNTGDDFVAVQDVYTINSLLMFGIAINESGWGTSNYAMSRNNLFGLNAIDANPDDAYAFASVRACIKEFAYDWIHTGYMSGTDYRYRGAHLGDKHSGINVLYASDPFWGEKGAARPYYYDVEKKDYGRYTIGIANSGCINVYSEADTGSTRLYTSEAGSGSGTKGYLYDYPVVILDTVTGTDGTVFYKLISDMSLKEDRSARDVGAQFKASRDYVFAKASDITIVFEGSGKDIVIADPTIAMEDFVLVEEETGKEDEAEPEDGTTEENTTEESTETVEKEKTHKEVIAHLGLTKDGKYLSGFKLGGDVAAVLRKVKAFSDKITVIAKDKNGTQVTSGLLTTGMTITITTNGNTIVYKVVIRGDVSGDGKISALDYVKVRNYLDKKTNLTGAYLKSADASGDGKVSALDYVKVRNHLDKKSTITQ